MNQTQSVFNFSPYHNFNPNQFLKRKKQHANYKCKQLQISNQENSFTKQNSDEELTLENLIFSPLKTRYIDKSGSQTPDLYIINHDIELRDYLFGKKTFEQQSLKIQNFSIKEEQITVRIPKAKHRKQKSKSQITSRITFHSNNKLLSISNLNSIKQKEFSCKQNLKTQIDPYEQRKFLRHNKTVKYLDLNKDNQYNVDLKALQIQLVLKKATEKRQLNIKDIVKNFNLPKVNTVLGANLDKFVERQTKEKHSLLKLEKKTLKTKENHNQRMSATNLTAAINKLQESKIKDLRKLQRQILMSKRKSTQKLNMQNSFQSKQLAKQFRTAEKFRSVY